MNKTIKNVGIILAGGIGSRFQGEKPKQYYEIDGKEMIWYSIDAFKRSKKTDAFIVVLNDEDFLSRRIEKKYNIIAVRGGATRNKSFKNALNYIKKVFPFCEKIVENNAACPLVTSKLIDEYFDILDKYDYVQTTSKITDALGCYWNNKVNRDDYFLIQSPDGYRFDLVFKYFDENCNNGHPASQLPTDSKGFNYFDFGVNIKVTYNSDLAFVESMIKNRQE